MDSFIAWVGGKKLLRGKIVECFPGKIEKYVEVFGGAGWVLFHKDKHASKEVYNDINSELVNLFRCVKYHPEAIEKELSLTLNSREIFGSYRKQTATEGLTEIQRAARYLYLIRASYGAKTSTFGGKNRDISDVKGIYPIKERLAKVLIENKSFPDLIKLHDSEGTLFYCDPPYHTTERYYDTGDFVFDESQHVALKEMLSNIKGRFVLSYNDDEFIRELYKDFYIEEVQRTNNLALRFGNDKIYKELIIKNY